MGQELLEVNREVRLKRARDFVELTRIHLLAKSGDHLGIARLRNTSATVLDLLEKGAVSPMATTDPGASARTFQKLFTKRWGFFVVPADIECRRISDRPAPHPGGRNHAGRQRAYGLRE